MMNSAKMAKRPPRLIPFNEDDASYFEEWGTAGIDEKFTCIADSFYSFIKYSEYSEYSKDFNNSHPIKTQVMARSLRISVREFQHYFKQLAKHLEKIEVTGEWK